MKMTPYPLRLQPAYKDYLWGGDRIPRVFGRDLPPGRYAESWELSARPEGPSAVANGPLAGRPLADAIALDPRAQLGAGLEKSGLPLLVKIIDARERLKRHAVVSALGEAAAEIVPVATHGERGGADRSAKVEGEDLAFRIASKLQRHQRQQHRLAGAGRADD